MPSRASICASAGPSGTAPIGPLAVLDEEGEFGVGGADEVFDAAVLIDVHFLAINVIDYHTDRRACGYTFHQAGKHLNLIGFLPWRVQFALARAPLIKLGLYMLNVELESRGHAVNDSGQPGAVRLAAGGYAKHTSEGVA